MNSRTKLALGILPGLVLGGIALAQDAAKPLREVPFPEPRKVYVLREGSEFTPMEASYARACVAYFEAQLNAPQTAPEAFQAALSARKALARSDTTATPVVVTRPPAEGTRPESATEANAEPAQPSGTPIGPAAATGKLVAGNGPEPNPPREPVKGRARIPWDGVTRASAALAYGVSKAVFNLFDDDRRHGSVPMQVSMSLDGGPWIDTRGTVTLDVNDDAEHQVRIVAWPLAGQSLPWPPIVVRRDKTGAIARVR